MTRRNDHHHEARKRPAGRASEKRLRTTFLPGREVIERAREHLLKACDGLRNAPRPDLRSTLLCDVLESLQQELAEAMGRFEEIAPSALLETQAQYTIEVPTGLEVPPPCASGEESLRWALALADSLRSAFDELGESSQNDHLAETYRGFATLVEGFEERISQLEQGLRDL